MYGRSQMCRADNTVDDSNVSVTFGSETCTDNGRGTHF